MNEVSDSYSGDGESIYFVASALEATWPKEDRIIFLGEWCLRYSRRDVWSRLDHSVATYHWDDRSQIPKDLEYINGVYETMLPELARILNGIHGVDYSVRYWRIVVGWWLFYFTQIFFDRWQVMQAAVVAYPDARMLRMPNVPPIPASGNMKDFLEAMSSEVWNERLFADIAVHWTSIRVDLAADVSTNPGENKTEPEGQRGNLSMRRKMYVYVKRAIDWLGRNRVFYGEGVALHSDYLRRLEKVKLALMLRQIPIMKLEVKLPKFAVSTEQRKWIVPTLGTDAFASALAELVPLYLPACYLEGYAEVSKLTESSGFIHEPKVIMTANAFSSDDFWKIWAALQVERGAKLVIAQHGGHYGTGAWSAMQMHEIAISDRYLSWGWRDASQPKVYPAPATKIVGMKRGLPSRSGKCLLVTCSLPPQSYLMYSIPAGPQVNCYLEDQLRFAAALSDEVRENLVVRLYAHDYGWDTAERWKDSNPSIQVDLGQSPMKSLLTNTKLYVATYNATTFLESFTQGIPTVMFWNPAFWELSDEALPYFDCLRAASVLFDDPVTCAEHVNNIWPNVPAWWASPEVKSAVESFAFQFAYTGNQPLRELKSALTQW
jgi:putative transferase (TIGR04331 family)